MGQAFLNIAPEVGAFADFLEGRYFSPEPGMQRMRMRGDAGKFLKVIAGWMVAAWLIFGEAVMAQTGQLVSGSSIQARIDEAYAQGARQVVIPAGTYQLFAPPGKTAHLKFEGFKNFDIEATGVTFLLGTRNKLGVDFEKCEAVTFRGATLIHDPLPFSQGKICRPFRRMD